MRALKDWLCVCVVHPYICYTLTHFILDLSVYFPTICNVVFHPVPVPHRHTSEIKALALSVYYKNDYLKLAHSAVYLHKDSCVMTWQNRLVIQPSERVIDWPALTPNQTLTCWICSDLPGLKEVLGCVWEPEEREKQSKRKEALKRAKKNTCSQV